MIEQKESIEIGSIRCFIVSAGSWWGDGGALFGVMPKALWQKFIEFDELNRIKLALNSLLIQVDQKHILIDTGLGNELNSKQKKIYNPSEFLLVDNLHKLGISRFDIDFVIFTHLHFDHAGGIYSLLEGRRQLTFPNAVHIIQEKEWKLAKYPDDLNRASYDFGKFSLLEKSGKYRLINGDEFLFPEIKLELVGGHTEGSQVVRIESEGKLAYYPGDILPLESHRFLSITTAYDTCRKDTARAKKRILAELVHKEGLLFLNHDQQKNYIRL